MIIESDDTDISWFLIEYDGSTLKCNSINLITGKASIYSDDFSLIQTTLNLNKVRIVN